MNPVHHGCEAYRGCRVPLEDLPDDLDPLRVFAEHQGSKLRLALLRHILFVPFNPLALRATGLGFVRRSARLTGENLDARAFAGVVNAVEKPFGTVEDYLVE